MLKTADHWKQFSAAEKWKLSDIATPKPIRKEVLSRTATAFQKEQHLSSSTNGKGKRRNSCMQDDNLATYLTLRLKSADLAPVLVDNSGRLPSESS